MKALHDLIQIGKVRYIGASSMRAWQFALLQETAEKNGWTKFVSMQNEISLLYREEVSHNTPTSSIPSYGQTNDVDGTY
jgi:aryl-alcohol dehydrogenase-like predicted oxidoreductase